MSIGKDALTYDRFKNREKQDAKGQKSNLIIGYLGEK